MNERKQIRVRYVDFWPGFVPEKQTWHKILSNEYELVEVNNPDYIIDGGLGCHHLKYDCIKVLKLAENLVPDFNNFDYAIGYDFLTFGDRYVRVPSYAFYDSYRALYNRTIPSDDTLLNRGFCSFVVSNPVGDPMRELFFKRLSEYKKVDSGGKWMNNVGGPVKDKLAFCRELDAFCREADPSRPTALANFVVGQTELKVIDDSGVPTDTGRESVIRKGNERLGGVQPHHFPVSGHCVLAAASLIERGVDSQRMLSRGHSCHRFEVRKSELYKVRNFKVRHVLRNVRKSVRPLISVIRGVGSISHTHRIEDNQKYSFILL